MALVVIKAVKQPWRDLISILFIPHQRQRWLKK